MFIVVLAKEDKGPVTLTCNSTPGTAITWKLNNDPIDNLMFRTLLTQNDQHLILSGVDFSMLGNYSCWSEGRALSSVYLLFEIEEPGETFLLILLSFHHCTCHMSNSCISFINSMFTLMILAEDQAFFDCLLIWTTLSDLLWFVIYFAVLSLWSSQILRYTAGQDRMTVSSTVNGRREHIQQCE